MIHRLLLLSYMLILSGCVTITNQSFNTPFINADETIHLEQGMTKQDVLEKIGEPLYIDYGINGTAIWIYEVRTITVKSNTSSTGEIAPNKTNHIIKYSKPIHRLKLTLMNNKVLSWGIIHFSEKINKYDEPIILKEAIQAKVDKGEIIIPTQINSKEEYSNQKVQEINHKIKFIPSISLLSTFYDRGTGFGVNLMKNKWGVEFNLNKATETKNLVTESSFGATNIAKLTSNYTTLTSMLIYEYQRNNMNIQVGLGLSFRSQDNTINKGIVWNNVDMENNIFGISKRISIGRYLNYKKIKFLPMIELQEFDSRIGLNMINQIIF